jgi:hypothetical protein
MYIPAEVVRPGNKKMSLTHVLRPDQCKPIQRTLLKPCNRDVAAFYVEHSKPEALPLYRAPFKLARTCFDVCDGNPENRDWCISLSAYGLMKPGET